ncbi:unnamed protein product [Rotaria sordida]|uniref:Receptor ligand binding region domain-containing protein n=1 Tax=Rotaria sordida TaxID=392033 RepID=A0A820KK53_9BILA|nr:unnamed protein product [Rotaria sordida]
MSGLNLTCHAVSVSNVVGIVGPSYSREAHVIAPFSKVIGIPVISHSATDPDLSNRNAYPNFYRTVASDFVVAAAHTTTIRVGALIKRLFKSPRVLSVAVSNTIIWLTVKRLLLNASLIALAPPAPNASF